MFFWSDFAGFGGDMPPLLLETTVFDFEPALTLDPWTPSAGHTESERKTDRCELEG